MKTGRMRAVGKQAGWMLAGLLMAASLAGGAMAAKSPYLDLLPPKAVLKDSTERLDAATLKQSALGVIPTTAFVKQTRLWTKHFGDDGTEKHLFALGLKRETTKLGAVVMDPRRVIDTAMLDLQPRFASVTVYEDLASSRDAGAQYYLLLHYDQIVVPPFIIGGGVRGFAGAALLDARFERQFEFVFEKASAWAQASFLAGANGNMMAWSKSVDDNFGMLLPAFTEELDKAFAGRGAAKPAVAAVATSADADPVYGGRLAAAGSAGELYAIGDEMAEGAQPAKAAQAFRAVMTRFPDNALAVKAAERLAQLPR